MPTLQSPNGYAPLVVDLPPVVGDNIHNVTVKAVAMYQELQSDVSSLYYNVHGAAFPPMFDPPGGHYHGLVTVTMNSRTPAADIFYTTDGQSPSTSPSLIKYTGPRAIVPPVMLWAFANMTGLGASVYTKAQYSNSSSKPSLSLDAIVGISVAAIALCVVTVGLTVWVRRRRGAIGSSLETPLLEHKTRPQEPPLSREYDWHIEREDVVLGEVVGAGAYGRVRRGTWRDLTVAVKDSFFVAAQRGEDSHVDAADSVTSFGLAEVLMMARLRHPNIVQFFGACVEQSQLMIVLEFCDNGSLRDVLRRVGSSSPPHDLPSRYALHFALGIARGMEYLHNHPQPIIHRDLKSHNVLVSHDWTVKVADFGLARVADHEKTMTQNIGTVPWLSPELIAHARYSLESDVYAYGIILWEILARGDELYEGMRGPAICLHVGSGGRPPVDVGADVPDAEPLCTLMQRCWAQQPEERPSFTQVLHTLPGLSLN
mmetsp:Transcript_8917/g.19282  ORF Transcript_8917/g.19282 Transcript_8917/m.19282 type:complete len:484 (+) Transcript_8917:883-2334(+)